MGRLCGVDGLLGVQTVFDGVFHGLDPQMSEEWVGCVVSINCGATLGHYQGQVTNLNHKEQTVTISQAYRNGRKSEIDNITIW